MSEFILRVVAGNAAGTELKVGDELLLGRSAGKPGNLASDATLSRRHAEVRRDAAGQVVIEDLGSHNGTAVNGQRLDGPCVLSPGDRIEVGETTLELVRVGPPPPESGATRISHRVVTPPPPPADAPAPALAAGEQVTRLGKAPVEERGAQPVPTARAAATRVERPPEPVAAAEQATRLGKVPDAAEQATRLGKVPGAAEQATRLGKVPDAAEQATRLGKVPGAAEQATRLGKVPGAAEQATRLGKVPADRGGDQGTRLGKVPSQAGDGQATRGRIPVVPPDNQAAGTDAVADEPHDAEPPRTPWWKRLRRLGR